jgi:toxin ParE1/3/4
MKVSISESAFNDLEGITAFYVEEGVPEVGARIIEEIVDHFEVLITHPDIGRVVPEFSVEHIREIIHPPFRLVYFREEKEIKIIRVWRSERLLVLPYET